MSHPSQILYLECCSQQNLNQQCKRLLLILIPSPLICPLWRQESQNAISCSNQSERNTGANMAQRGRRYDIAGSLSLFKALS